MQGMPTGTSTNMTMRYDSEHRRALDTIKTDRQKDVEKLKAEAAASAASLQAVTQKLDKVSARKSILEQEVSFHLTALISNWLDALVEICPCHCRSLCGLLFHQIKQMTIQTRKSSCANQCSLEVHIILAPLCTCLLVSGILDVVANLLCLLVEKGMSNAPDLV